MHLLKEHPLLISKQYYCKIPNKNLSNHIEDIFKGCEDWEDKQFKEILLQMVQVEAENWISPK